jgi:hypothetical protein
VGYAQERDPASGWAREEVLGHDAGKYEKGFLFFKSFPNFKPI